MPFLAYGRQILPNVDLGTRNCFGDVGATVLDAFGLNKGQLFGMSFWRQIVK